MLNRDHLRCGRFRPVGPIFAVALGLAVVVLLGTGVKSLPRLSVEHATPCRTCHINPNGGGMRTEFGNQTVALNELCLPQTRGLVAEHALSPRIAPALQVGFDSRTLVYDDGTILRMQTDFYADITPFDHFHYYNRFGEDGISESFALLQLYDERYYLKAGRFYPAYGLHPADHETFARVRTGHPWAQYLNGLSLGADWHGVNLVAEGFNHERRNIFGFHAYGTRELSPVGLMAGGSFRWSEKMAGSNGQFPSSRSVFGGVTWDRFTVLGELDLVGRSGDTLITYVNLTTRLEPGLYLIGEYNFFDGDRDFRGGVDEYIRFSAEIFPLPYVELRPSYTYYTRGYLEKTDDFFVQVHFGY